MSLFADRVKDTTTTTGTGAITLANSAPAGYQTFASAFGASAITVGYCIQDQNGPNWEVGTGTFNGTTGLTRTVLASSNAGSLVNFGAGTKDVFCTLPASYILAVDSTGTAEANTLDLTLRPRAPTASENGGTIAITARTATGSAKAGGAININSGAGLTSGSGGAVSIVSGASPSGSAGSFSLTAGGTASGSGGGFTISAGSATSSGSPGGMTVRAGSSAAGVTGGTVSILGGSSPSGVGGLASVTGGAGGSASTGGAAILQGGGSGTTGTGGTAKVLGGAGKAGGAVLIAGQDGGSSSGGSVTIQAGSNSNTGTPATVTIAGGDAFNPSVVNGGDVSIRPGNGTNDAGTANGLLHLQDGNSSDLITINDAALGLFGVTPIARPTTAGAAATFAVNVGTAVNDASTFDGYTLKQVVKALRNLGLLT